MNVTVLKHSYVCLFTNDVYKAEELIGLGRPPLASDPIYLKIQGQEEAGRLKSRKYEEKKEKKE